MSTPPATPRTDAVDAANEFSYTIPLEFARTLERELIAERAYVSALEDQLDSYGIKMAQQQAARPPR